MRVVNIPKPKRMKFTVPFSEVDQHPIQVTTLHAGVDALDEACRFRGLDPKDWALAKLTRTA